MAALKILLAEDEPQHRELLEFAILEGCPDAAITSVDTGKALIDAAKRSQFDCVVLDFNLPDARADELLQDLNAHGNRCPVVVVSSASEQDVVVRSLRSGGADFVPKRDAVCGSALSERIQAAIESHHRRQREQRVMERRVRRLARLAETDPLTGLANRLGFQNLAKGAREYPDRRGRLCVAILDVDHFKRVNDTWGHPCGDRVLQGVAQRIKACSELSHLACRWGGEEFLLVMPDTLLGTAWMQTETIRRAIEEMRIDWDGRQISVTASVGLSQCLFNDTWDDCIGDADEALFAAKQNGRNQVHSRAMVALNHLTQDEVIQHIADAWQQMQQIVSRAGSMLGCTQKDHLLGHGGRVGELALRIGQQLNMKNAELGALHRGGIFHDLGKFTVPEDILAKPGPLTPDELLCYRRQAEYADAVGRKSGLLPAASGPDASAAGQAGPPVADALSPTCKQIIALADAYDAMVSPRPYRATRTPAEALSELESARGKQLETHIVDAAMAVLR